MPSRNVEAWPGIRLMSDRSAGPVRLLAAGTDPTGRRLVAAGPSSGGVTILDVADGGIRRSLDAGVTQHLAMGGDGAGRLLLAEAQGRRIGIWDPVTGQHLTTIDSPRPASGLAVGPDGRGGLQVVAGFDDGHLASWDTDSGRLNRHWQAVSGRPPRVFALALGVDTAGRGLLVCAGPETLCLFDAFEHRPGPVLDVPGRCHAVAVGPMPDGGLVVAAGWPGGEVHLWDATGRPLGALAGSDGGARVLTVAVDGGSALLCASNGDVLEVWDVSTRTLLRATPTEERLDYDSASHVLFRTRRSRWSIALTPGPGTGTELLTGYSDGTVEAADPRSGAPRWQRAWSWRAAVAVAVTTGPDAGVLLTVADDDGTLEVFRAADGGRVHTLTTGPGTVWALAATTGPDGTALVAAAGEGSVDLWDVASGRRYGRIPHPYGLPAPHQAIQSVRWVTAGPAGSAEPLLATAGADGLVRVFDVTSGALVRTLDRFAGRVRRVALGHDDAGRPVVAGVVEGVPGAWVHDLGTGRPLVTLEPAAPAGRPAGLTDDPGSTVALGVVEGRAVLATADHEGTVHVWDLAHGALRHVWHLPASHGAPPLAFVAKSTGPAQLVVAVRGQVRLLDVVTGAADEPLAHPLDPVRSLAVGGAGAQALVIGGDGEVRAWQFG